MTDPYADLGGRRESYAEALARSEACLNPPRTEQDDAAAIVAKREAQRQHDAYFAPYFISPVEEVVISRHLARKLGYTIREESRGGWDMDDDGSENLGEMK